MSRNNSIKNIANKYCRGVKNICPFNNISERNLNNYCKNCFFYLFPNDEKVKKMHIKNKEIEVVNYICYDNPITNKLNWVFNRQIETDNECASNKRIDLRHHKNNTILCIEIDEDQHLKYGDECDRYNDIIAAHSQYKYIFIRYNPDPYKVNDITIDPNAKLRLTKLSEMIKEQINRIDKNENNDLLEIYYLFYNDNTQSKTDKEKDFMIELLLKSMSEIKKNTNKKNKSEYKIKINDDDDLNIDPKIINTHNESHNVPLIMTTTNKTSHIDHQNDNNNINNSDVTIDIYACNKCNREFKYRSEYLRHIDKKIPCNNDEKINFFKQKKKCPYCDKEFARVDAVARHIFTCSVKLKQDATNKRSENVQVDKLLKEIQNMKNRISYLENK